MKAVLDRVVRDCKELAQHGVGSIAIMSNDPTDYPEDSFDNMTRVAREKAMVAVAKTGRGPQEQIASIGCSIKWKS